MKGPIGILDSGVGGLSVASRILAHLPCEEIVYFGDSANVPYGEKKPETIRKLVYRIIDFFVSQKAKAVVMACNSSSALVLEHARKRYAMPIVGVIEPAIQEALRVSRKKSIGLFANAVTVASGAHQETLTRISRNGVKIVPQACPHLVPLVEEGQLWGEETERVLREYLCPIEKSGTDTLILGCTHYPFLEETIRALLSTPLNIIDPGELTALTLKEILGQAGLLSANKEKVSHRFYVSGDAGKFRQVGSKLLGRPLMEVAHLDLP
ncbi:MAG: glutamate racemase [Candidatus Eremiobacteraeota bacterium]|nr:glutamate racemase [Candidatus Eremiobacteraeota bacterium]